MSPWEVRSNPEALRSRRILGACLKKGAPMIPWGKCPQEVPPGMPRKDRRAGPAPTGPPPQDVPQPQGNQQGHGFHGSGHAERGRLQRR